MTRLEELLEQQIKIAAAIDAEVKKNQDAADKGDSEAQFQLAVINYKGQGVKQNFGEAIKCFKLAAAKGHTAAEFFLGTMFAKGQGTAQNYAEALHYFQLAATKDYSQAQYMLGVMFDGGKGVTVDGQT